jgi:hypothetical protein
LWIRPSRPRLFEMGSRDSPGYDFTHGFLQLIGKILRKWDDLRWYSTHIQSMETSNFLAGFSPLCYPCNISAVRFGDGYFWQRMSVRMDIVRQVGIISGHSRIGRAKNCDNRRKMLINMLLHGRIGKSMGLPIVPGLTI